MDIVVTITNPTPAVLAALAGTSPAVAEIAKATKPAVTKTAKEPEKAPEPAAEPQEATVDIALTVKQRAQEVAAKNGRDAVAELIKKSGGTTGISTIPEANREDFIALCDAALAE